MSNHIGEEIYRGRKSQKLTQDQFGSRFNVSGPAIFKLEKGLVHPSLDLWLRISSALKIPERKAVLMWIKDRLPERLQDVIDLKRGKVLGEDTVENEDASASTDYELIPDKKEIRRTVLKDAKLPRGLKSLFRDDEFWNTYKPTGAEINFLADHFCRFARATKALFREAFILHRQFTGKMR